jgi:hypothetical protein
LNIDFGINNGRQYCKIGTVRRGYLWEGRVNGGHEGEGIWLRGFIYICKIGQ